MKFDKPKCPKCGAYAQGTVDNIPGLAVFGPPDKDESFEYSGSTEVWWDEQRTVTDKKRRMLLMCPKGHRWFSRATSKRSFKVLKKGGD
jgi:hypothetical protein